jgi:hypothetical protein
MSNTKVKIASEEPEDNQEEVTTETEEVKGTAFIEIVEMDEEPVQDFGVQVEDLDPKEELWTGGPTAGQIVEWKEQYGDVYVTSITMEDHIIWRTMNRFEYKNHVKNIERLGQSDQVSQADVSMLNEELIAEMCILYPPFDRTKLNSELAGVPSIIAQEVMEASGFVALEVRQL